MLSRHVSPLQSHRDVHVLGPGFTRWCGTSTAATCWVVWIVPTALSRPGRSRRVHSLQCHGACELGWKSAGEAAGLETDAFPLGAEQSLGGQLLGPLLRSHFSAVGGWTDSIQKRPKVEQKLGPCRLNVSQCHFIVYKGTCRRHPQVRLQHHGATW